MIVAVVPFALGPDLDLLARIGPAILWIAAVLATLIGLDRLFQADEEDGSLDLLRAAPVPLEIRGSRQGDRPLAHHRPAPRRGRAALRPPPRAAARGDAGASPRRFWSARRPSPSPARSAPR